MPSWLQKRPKWIKVSDIGVVIMNNRDFPEFVGEEVVLDPSGQWSASVSHFRLLTEAEKSMDGLFTTPKAKRSRPKKKQVPACSSMSDVVVKSHSYSAKADVVKEAGQAAAAQQPPEEVPHLCLTKPKMSYAQLIAEALMNSEQQMLTLSEIYQAISSRHPYFRCQSKNWQNSIRHNLTMNKSFYKVPRHTSEGRGCFWRLEPHFPASLFLIKNTSGK